MPRWSLFFLASIFSSLVLAQTPVPKIKILSLNFNSEDVPADKNQVVRDLRFNSMVDWIKKNDVDVMLIQEAWNYRGESSVARALAKALDYDFTFRLDTGFPLFMYDSDVVLAKKKFSLSNARAMKLPHSAPIVGNGSSWVIPLGRTSYAVSAKLKLENGETLYVYSTHLVTNTDNKRKDQAEAIHQDILKRAKSDGISEERIHAVIAGDFNAKPNDPAPEFLVSQGYQDSFDYVHPGDPSCTFCANLDGAYFNPLTIGANLFPSQAGEKEDMRLDYIFARSNTLRPVSSEIVFTAPHEQVWMSDHYGMLTVLSGATSSEDTKATHDLDSEENPKTEVIQLTSEQFNHPTSPEVSVSGARGVSFTNETGFSVKISFTGPAAILTSTSVVLKPSERAAFSFTQKGRFYYEVKKHNLSALLKPRKFQSSVNVLKSGF